MNEKKLLQKVVFTLISIYISSLIFILTLFILALFNIIDISVIDNFKNIVLIMFSLPKLLKP